MTRRSALAVLRLMFGLLALIAVGWQLKIHVGLSYNVLNFFSYFTNLSNLIAAVVLLQNGLKYFAGSEPTSSSDELRLLSTVNMVVVGVVFAILLRNVELGSLLPWINTVLHYVMPIVVALDWMIDPPKAKPGLTRLTRILIFPALYLTYILLRGSTTGWYPYPFLNPANIGGYGVVALYAAAIALMFLLTGWALMTVANKRPPR